MAATEAGEAPVVQEDGKAAETKPAEAEPTANANSETASEATGKEGEVVDGEVENKETVAKETESAGAEGGAEDNAASSTEPKTSFLDSFLNKSGLGKVMAGRKKKEQSAVGEENITEGGEKEGQKEDTADDANGAADKAPENGEKEEDEKKAKQGECKSTVRDLIRKPVARIFSHRGGDKKEGGAAAAEPQNPLQVRSKSLDRLEDPEALNATVESTAEEGGAGEGEQKAASSSATTKHMKRWHSFKKLMAQRSHKKGGGGEECKEEGAEGVEEGGGDSSTLDSKESGQKRWKLKRSWTFQGLKRDPSVVGISSKAKGSSQDSAPDCPKGEEATGGAEGGEEATDGCEEDGKMEGGEEKADGAEEEKVSSAGGATVTQHANEIWTSFKKRVIPKSKRTNTECAPSGEEDAAAAAATSGEEAGGEDGKSAKAKRSHFGRAVSLKNFILRKGKSTSVDLGEGAKEEEEEGEAATDAEAAAAAETADKPSDEEPVASDAAVAAESGAELGKEAENTPVEKAAEAPVTNGENGCSNGTEDENATHNHQEEELQEEKTATPLKKGKEVGGAKEEANAKIINVAMNSDKKAGNV